MSAPKPAWRRTFDKVERTVGEPLESLANNPGFIGVAARGLRARNAVGRTAGGLVRGVTGKLLRAINLPTREDVQRLNRNLAVVAGEVRALSIAQSAPVPAVEPSAAEDDRGGTEAAATTAPPETAPTPASASADRPATGSRQRPR